MFLRSVTLRGFKSFADRTALEFGPGLSVIVGPNGSGKSNLVDAISWVLGEQGPAALRGGQMADVIFAGSPSRAALGMAEVSLVIDNEAGRIPVDATEVEVARVIYRSGESQYLIAGQPCRLMDVRELLSDTGIGQGLHTVVGQGHLEDVLLAKPEERRRYIEEAAGIAKHRHRRERAERKLARVEQDLVRLDDVLGELRRQLKPLKQQADVAKRHDALTREAGDLTWRIAAARLRHLYAQREERRAVWDEGLARRRHVEERLAVLDGEIARLVEELEEAEDELAAAERGHLESLRERAESERALREAMRAEGEAKARIAAAAGEAGRLFSLEEEIRRTEAWLGETIRSLEEKDRALEEAEREFRAAAGKRQEQEEAHHRARDEVTHRRAQRDGLRLALDSAIGERERLHDEMRHLEEREARLQIERETLEAEIERLDAAEAALTARREELGRAHEREAAEATHLEDGARRLEARVHALDTQARVAAETPGRKLLGTSSGQAIGLLGELLVAEPGMEAALAAALGPLADAVVYAERGEAVAAAPGAAGATVVWPTDARARSSIPGARRLADAVRPDPRVRSMTDGLLRDVYVVDDAKDAVASLGQHPEASFVTRDGVLVGPSLARSAPDAVAGEDAAEERSAVGRDLDRVRAELAAGRDRRTRLEAALQEVAGEQARADSEITALAERVGRLDVELAGLGRERDVLAGRLERIAESIRETETALAVAAAEPGPEDLPPPPPHVQPPIALRVEAEALRRERSRLEAGLERARRELAEAASRDPHSMAGAAERSHSAGRAAEKALAEVEARLAAEAARHQAEATRVGGLRAAHRRANDEWRRHASELQSLRDEYEEVDRIRLDLERRITEAERLITEGHARTPEEAVAALADDDTAESLERRAGLVSRRLGLLGRVNQVASEEYAALQERHDFLAREMDDVRASRRDLERVILEVDRRIVEVFDQAFREVAEEFAAVFALLFPEGEGKLVITDPGNLLETGVEIGARPGRKRVKRLSLLSGGERSLTALAFLFAIFRARPSPFYLLDEVEAALDDVNLVRFLGLVREFASSSQVLLVTHQKRTMEAADVLYGVSMGGEGASAIIAERFEPSTPGDVAAVTR